MSIHRLAFLAVLCGFAPWTVHAQGTRDVDPCTLRPPVPSEMHFIRGVRIDAAGADSSRRALVVRVASYALPATPLVSVSVDVFQDSAGALMRRAGAATDSGGVVAFARLEPAVYILRVRGIGYRTFQGPVNLRTGSIDTARVQLVADVIC